VDGYQEDDTPELELSRDGSVVEDYHRRSHFFNPSTPNALQRPLTQPIAASQAELLETSLQRERNLRAASLPVVIGTRNQPMQLLVSHRSRLPHLVLDLHDVTQFRARARGR